jgi:predicted amidohydrolase
MRKIAIAGLQLDGPNGDNLDRVEAEIAGIVRRFPWVDMVVASELNVCGTDPAAAEPRPGPREERLRAIARRHEIWLVPGSMFEATADRVYNTVPVIDPAGTVVVRYRKLFPWLPYETNTTPGLELAVFDVPGIGRFGLSNCYDIWFPETIRGLVGRGAEVILHPSLTSTIDRAAEHCIIRATAAMFQCVVFDVNLGPSVGVGQSLVAGPGGEILHVAGRGREIFPLYIDLDTVSDARACGWHGLGQTLKSWRDSNIDLTHYTGGTASDYLDSLGPLTMPGRQVRR